MSNDWKPGDDLYFHIEDKTHEPRTESQLEQMYAEIQEVINRYDFDLDTWGTLEPMGEHLDKMREIKRKYEGIHCAIHGSHKGTDKIDARCLQATIRQLEGVDRAR